MTQSLYPGGLDPLRSVVIVESSDANFDLALVASAVILAVLPDNTEKSWPATLSAQTSTSVTLTRIHEAGDIPDDAEGTAYLRAQLTLAGGEILETTSAPAPIAKLGA